MPIYFVANNVEMLFWKVLITVVLAHVYISWENELGYYPVNL